MDDERYKECIDRAAQCLSRACEQAAAAMDEGEVGVKEIRELTVALKELASLRRSLGGEEDMAEATAVEVSFDEESDEWSR